MAKKDRTGNRKTRDQRKQFKVPELGYYLIVTDTEATERCFFIGLHQALPEDVRNKLVIKVVETKTRTMIDKCLEITAYDAQYRIPWIVFDRDQVQGFDEIIKEAEDNGIQVGWSNPCFEIWMYAYFGSMPAIRDSWTCCSEFGRVYETKTGQKYSKADEQMYGKICKAGDEEKAIQIAQQKLEQCKREGKTKPSEMCPCTTVHELVGEIKAKIKWKEFAWGQKKKTKTKEQYCSSYKKRALQKPEIKAEYDALQPEYDIIQAMIDARVQQNMTQKDLSAKTGITQADISRIENGTRNPSLSMVKKLAHGLGMQLKLEFVPMPTKNKM